MTQFSINTLDLPQLSAQIHRHAIGFDRLFDELGRTWANSAKAENYPPYNIIKVDENNLVVKVDLMVTGINGNNSASAAYTRNLVRSETFIPYEQLTEQQILDWCFAPENVTWTNSSNVEQSTVKYLKDEGEAQVADQIQRQLDQAKNEPALPWAQIPA